MPATAGKPAVLPPMPIVSFGVPAYASSGTASHANDRSYDTAWRSNETTSPSTPSWIAYDLSSVPAARRGPVDIAWDNGNGGYNDYEIFPKGGDAYNLPRDYTLDASAAAGGSVPGSGWVTLVTVTGNTYFSREHAVNLAGYNWLRMKVTAINGCAMNLNTSLNLDVHDASHGVSDAWLFLGDSITAFAMRNDGAGISARSFPELINAARPAYFPASEGAGEGGWNSGTALATPSPDGQGSLFDHWLSTFPGTFVGLSYGTNDGANGSAGATPTYSNLVTMVKKVIAAGKRPCIPHVPWAEDADHQTSAKLINSKIDQIYDQYPQVVRGPDLWAALMNRRDLYQDELHPNAQGRAAYREAWAKAMLSEVYP
jgi:lysophospholipase L1-like esterase